MKTRLTLTLALAAAGFALSLVGCDPARLVDCNPGEFVRAEGTPWCVLPRSVMPSSCPDSLSEEHDLPWGGRGCAAERHQPVPRALCVAVGECSDDAGGDGG